MARIAVLVLAGTDTKGDLGRVVNAFETANEFSGGDDDLQLIFDGAGTQWIEVLADPEHNYHDLYRDVKGAITGACQYCANAYGVKQSLQDEGITMLKENRGHPSIRSLVTQGYQVITF